MKKVAVVAVLLAAAVGAILAGGGHAKAPGSRTFHLIEGNGGTFHFVDNPPRAKGRNPNDVSPGDQFVFTTPLLTTTRKHAGWLFGACTVVLAARARSVINCTGTANLAGGKLAFVVNTRFDENVSRIPIVGGTGAYEGARGSVISVSHANGTSSDTIHLLP
jgi:hypothetical protein